MHRRRRVLLARTRVRQRLSRIRFRLRVERQARGNLTAPPRLPDQPTGPVGVSRWRVSLKLRRSQVPSGWTTRREIEPLSAWMKAKGRLEVAIAQSWPIVAPWAKATAVVPAGTVAAISSIAARRRPWKASGDSAPGI